tara:strand:- start:828 stop:1037 length:210 start_codon:yes stop_codon:yes gene_type:complete
MAFLLVVIVNNEVISDDTMLFKDVYRCNKFARAIEKGQTRPDEYIYYDQKNISAYCIPRMVESDTTLYE